MKNINVIAILVLFALFCLAVYAQTDILYIIVGALLFLYVGFIVAIAISNTLDDEIKDRNRDK